MTAASRHRHNQIIEMHLFATVALFLTALLALGVRGQDIADEESCSAAFGDDAIAACKAKVKVAWSSNEEGRPPDANPNECVDRRPEVCTQYAETGDCESNPGWMIMMCPVTCNACHLRDPAIRCPREKLGMSLDPAYQPGQLNAMFESIEARFAGQYGIEVLPLVLSLPPLYMRLPLCHPLTHAPIPRHRGAPGPPAYHRCAQTAPLTRQHTQFPYRRCFRATRGWWFSTIFSRTTRPEPSSPMCMSGSRAPTRGPPTRCAPGVA